MITAAYRGHVDAQINDQYHTLTGSLRFLNNIVRFPGCGLFDIESSFVALDRKAKNLIGLILCSRVRGDVGHVTQVCVLPEYRSHGIGESLLAATVANLRKRGFSMLSLTVTEANERAVSSLPPFEFRHQAGIRRVRMGRVTQLSALSFSSSMPAVSVNAAVQFARSVTTVSKSLKLRAESQ